MTAQVQTSPAERTRSTSAWLAWLLWTLTLAIIIADQVFGYLNDPSISLGDAFFALVLLASATVGALIASRRAENPIGWLLAAGTLLNALGSFALEYAVYTLKTAPQALPGGEWMLWFGNWVRSLGFFTLVAFVPLLFPNGRLPSRRWRPVLWIAIGEALIFALATLLGPTNQGEVRLPPLPNPLGVALPSAVAGPLYGIALLGIGAVTLLIAASVVVRFRHAEGEEREQLKWFAYAGLLAAVVFAIILFGVFALPDAVMARIGGALFSLLLAGFPIAIGVAILKYRLYEIDVLINRTLVYVPLTAILAGLFAASITLSQKLFIALAAQSSDAATVLTTLIVVAAFEPLKRRLQDGVDRRFKTARDPAAELKPFADLLQARIFAVDPASLARRLASETMDAFDAEGARVALTTAGRPGANYTAGSWQNAPALVIPLAQNGAQLGTLELGARKNGADYTPRDRAALTELASLVAGAVEPD